MMKIVVEQIMIKIESFCIAKRNKQSYAKQF